METENLITKIDGILTTQKSNVFRIKRTLQPLHTPAIYLDVLQQWNADILNPQKGFWSDIPTVTTDNDEELGDLE